jgi:hypothetical protein
MKWIFAFFLCVPQFVTAQWADTFADGNFTESPKWEGHTNKFAINTNGQLQLKAEAVTSEAWLFTASEATENAEWTIDVSMQFDPSSQNYSRVYLMSDRDNVTEAQNGFFVMVGGTDDDVSLYRLTNGIASKIIDGANGRLTASSVNITLKASYNRTDGWLLQTFMKGIWYTEGTSNVGPMQSSKWFGVYCRYSATRSDKFFFDNISVIGIPLQDVTSPSVTMVEVLRGDALSVVFSEPMDESSVDVQSFLLHPLNLLPVSIERLASDRFVIGFANRLIDGTLGLLRFSGQKDIAGNSLSDTSVVFAYHQLRCLGANALNANRLTLTFNKSVRHDDIDLQSFSLAPLNMNPSSIEVTDGKSLTLVFGLPMQNKAEYAITISGLTDENGDALANPTVPFHYFVSQRHDVVFSELMTDPDPVNQLPNAEFIELHNRTAFAISLSGHSLLVGSKKYAIEAGIVEPYNYICLVAQKDISLWSGYPNILAMKSFPALLNVGGSVVLLSAQGKVIDAVAYDEAWQSGGFKDDGGWSFERIDADVFSATGNWARSMHLSGGTPGGPNSIAAFRPDVSDPYVQYLEMPTINSVKLTFSEQIANLDSLTRDWFGSNGQIQAVYADTVWATTLLIEFDALAPNKQYHLSFIHPISDFAGNALMPYFPLSFALPMASEPNALVINEILFNPTSGQEDFIEIFNASDKTFLLSDLYVAMMDGETPKSLVRLSDKAIPVLPGSYWTFSPDPLPYTDNAKAPWWFMQTKSLPNFPDESGDVALLTVNGTIIDRLAYNEKWHFSLLNSKEGVSLERISSHQRTNDKNNWQSASYQMRYCSPTSMNSQAHISDSTYAGHFSLSSEVFSPDGDGHDDVLLIEGGEAMTGSVATVKVFDAMGRELVCLANNQLLGNGTQWKWDGTNSRGQLMPNGIYIIWIRCFDTLGSVFEEKKVCVVGSRQR